MNIPIIEKEYARTIAALKRTGIVTLLPRSKKSGVIGINGEEYPVPTREQLREVFTGNEKLVGRKMRQGFTELRLTPIAMPASQLIDRVRTAVLEHSAAGKIIRTKPSRIDQRRGVAENRLLYCARLACGIDRAHTCYA